MGNGLGADPVSKRIRVATIITRLAAGAGGVALRGALSVNPDEFDVVMVTGGASMTGQRGAQTAAIVSGADAVKNAAQGDLLAQAYDAGLSVARIANLVPEIAPRKDRAALQTLKTFLTEGDFDVVHTHSAKAGALGRRAATQAGVRQIVHTFHGFPFHDFQPAWRRAAYVAIERRLGRDTNAFLAIGSGVAAEAVRRRIALPERVRTIPPAIENVHVESGVAARGLARRRLGLPTGLQLVGTVGRIDYQKAPEHWVDALASIKEHDVWGIWIGDGPMREQLIEHARKRGVDQRLVVLGHRDDVRELLPAFDVFAMASLYEGLPCALLEAIEAGVPAVATAVNAVPDVIVPGETGLLVPAGQPRLLGRAIKYMLDNPDDAARMARGARERIADRYTPQALGLVLDRIYRGSNQ
jgi:glycosyltransferase involved in cell wall biosynthesis